MRRPTHTSCRTGRLRRNDTNATGQSRLPTRTGNRTPQAIAEGRARPSRKAGKPKEATSSVPVKLISPSRIARYFFHECPRYLRYSSTPKELWDVEGVPAPPFDHSPVTAAILEGRIHLGGGGRCRPGSQGRVFIADAKPGTRLKDRVFGAAETRRSLAGLEPGAVDLPADADHAAGLLRALRDSTAPSSR